MAVLIAARRIFYLVNCLFFFGQVFLAQTHASYGVCSCHCTVVGASVYSKPGATPQSEELVPEGQLILYVVLSDSFIDQALDHANSVRCSCLPSARLSRPRIVHRHRK